MYRRVGAKEIGMYEYNERYNEIDQDGGVRRADFYSVGRISLGARVMATPCIYARIPHAREGRGMRARVSREFLAVRVIRSFYVRSKKGADQRANAALLWLRRSRGHGSLSAGPSILPDPFSGGAPRQFRPSHLKTLEKYTRPGISTNY